MNFYPHHIGDFNSETRGSSRLERSVYRDMRDLYFHTEGPLPLDMKTLYRKVVANTPEEIAAVDQVLEDFFEQTDAGWFNKSCADQIEIYHKGLEKSSAGGRAKAEKAAAKAAEDAAKAAATAAKAAKAKLPAAARTLPEECAQSAGSLPEECAQLREGCEQLRAGFGQLREGANQNQNQNQNQIENNPVTQPTLIEDYTRGATPVELSIALRKHGVNCQPADPRLIALADQGMTVETAIAACIEAKKSKPDQPVIALGYVVGILSRWAGEAATIVVGGASPPARASPNGFESAKDRARRITIEGLTGQSSNERQHEIIDITPAVA